MDAKCKPASRFVFQTMIVYTRYRYVLAGCPNVATASRADTWYGPELDSTRKFAVCRAGSNQERPDSQPRGAMYLPAATTGRRLIAPPLSAVTMLACEYPLTPDVR